MDKESSKRNSVMISIMSAIVITIYCLGHEMGSSNMSLANNANDTNIELTSKVTELMS